MSFLLPTAFILTALVPVIIAMYLLKLRRAEQVVSSVYLWRRMVRDLEANAPWQRLRHSWLLLLQLALLAALILALARPFRWVEGVTGRTVVLVLDTSASMAATDVAPDRLAAARAQAQALVDGLPEEARVTLIVAGAESRVAVAASQDRRQVREALAALRPQPVSGDLTPALNLAAAITARLPEAEIVLLSDGGGLPEQVRLPAPLRYLPVGQGSDNQALSALTLQTGGAGQGVSVFVQATNYGPAEVTRRLALYADGELVNAFDLTLAPGAQKGLVVEDLPAGLEVLEARLLAQDDLALDDRAWAVRQTRAVMATLVTPGNLFLETALALLPNLELTIVKPEDWEDGRMEDWKVGRPKSDLSNLPTFQPATLTILDTDIPLTATLPTENVLLLAPIRSTGWFSVTGKVEMPTLRAVNPEDPLLRYVDLREFSVLEAAQVLLPEWARPVIVGDTAAGESWPLLFVGQVDGQRVAVLTFDLHRSDLPLTVSFPLLLSNLVGYLTPGAAGGLPSVVAPGEALALPVSPETQAVVVRAPDGTTARLVPTGGQAVFADTARLGVYRVTWQGEEGPVAEAAFAVNLFSPAESALAPREAPALVGEGTGQEETGLAQARQEWWRPLAWVALALLLLEWLVYQRPAVVRLWNSIMRQHEELER